MNRVLALYWQICKSNENIKKKLEKIQKSKKNHCLVDLVLDFGSISDILLMIYYIIRRFFSGVGS